MLGEFGAASTLDDRQQERLSSKLMDSKREQESRERMKSELGAIFGRGMARLDGLSEADWNDAD